MPIEWFMDFARNLLQERITLLKKQYPGDFEEPDDTIREGMASHLAERTTNYVLGYLLEALSKEELERLERTIDTNGQQQVIADGPRKFRVVYLDAPVSDQ